MSDTDMDWGPKRPSAVSWAGLLLVALGLIYLGAVGTALVLDADALLSRTEDSIATIFVLMLALLELAAGVGVIRLRIAWRLFGIALSVVGLGLHASNIVEAGGDSILISLNAAFVAVYLVVVVLLARNRAAFG